MNYIRMGDSEPSTCLPRLFCQARCPRVAAGAPIRMRKRGPPCDMVTREENARRRPCLPLIASPITQHFNIENNPPGAALALLLTSRDPALRR